MAEKVERLVNLTVALLEARRPLTLDDLRRRTGYYDQGDRESTRRMFERDKDDLRRLGVPIETRPTDAFEVETGYIIDRSAYEMPDIDLDADEVAALAVALRVAGDQGARLGLTKLAARAPDPAPVAAPVAERVTVNADALDDLADPLLERRTVGFDYRARSGEPSTRRVDPYAVVQRRGAWYLIGHDHDRDDLRVFRLDRIDGRIRARSEPDAFVRPSDLDIDAIVLGPSADEVEVLIAVAAQATWHVEVRGGEATGDEVAGWRVYRLPSVGEWWALRWVLEMGADVEVLAPDSLRTTVIDHLRALAAAS